MSLITPSSGIINIAELIFFQCFFRYQKTDDFETDFFSFFDVFDRFSVTNPNEQKGTPNSSAEIRFRIWQY